MRNPFHRHRYRELSEEGSCHCWKCRCGDRLWCAGCTKQLIDSARMTILFPGVFAGVTEVQKLTAERLYAEMVVPNEKPPESAGGLGDD